MAVAVYNHAAEKGGIEPDKYLPYIYEIIKPAIKGIKVSPEIAETLYGFFRKNETHAFHALNLSYSLTGPKKSCLREAINKFLILQDKLAREDFKITAKNFAGSFFLNNADVSNVRRKKSVIDSLIDFVSKEVFNQSREDQNKYFPVSYNVNQKIQLIEKHVDSLTEKECKQILTGFLQKINPILNPQSNSDDIRDNIRKQDLF